MQMSLTSVLIMLARRGEPAVTATLCVCVCVCVCVCICIFEILCLCMPKCLFLDVHKYGGQTTWSEGEGDLVLKNRRMDY